MHSLLFFWFGISSKVLLINTMSSSYFLIKCLLHNSYWLNMKCNCMTLFTFSTYSRREEFSKTMCSFEGLHTRFMSAGRCTDKHLIKEKRQNLMQDSSPLFTALAASEGDSVSTSSSQSRLNSRGDWTLYLYQQKWTMLLPKMILSFESLATAKLLWWPMPNFCGGTCQTFVS